MYRSSFALREAREAFAVTIAKWLVIFGIAVAGTITWFYHQAEAAEPTITMYQGEISGHTVTVTEPSPIEGADVLCTVKLCPVGDSFCKEKILGYKKCAAHEWSDVSIRATREPTAAEIKEAIQLLDRGFEAVYRPTP
jgi:hypothetical protein